MCYLRASGGDILIDELLAAGWLLKDGEEWSAWKDGERDCLGKQDRSRRHC
jgi:hypothetical protein